MTPVDAVVTSPDLVGLIARAVLDAAKAQHPAWLPPPPLPYRPSLFPDCSGGFAPARFACVSRTWRDEMTKLWLGPSFPSRDWATRLILEHVRDRMNLDTLDDMDDDASETDGPWDASDPALLFGARGSYRELRVTLCAGRRFYRDDLNVEELHSTSLSEPLPENARPDLSYDGAPTKREFLAALETDVGYDFKYTMPNRIKELCRNLEARGSPLAGCIELVCTGGQSEAGDDLVVGIKVGDLQKKLFYYNLEEEIMDACGSDDPDEIESDIRDVSIEIDESLETLLCRPLNEYAPPYFMEALEGAVLRAFEEFFNAVGPPPADDVEPIRDLLPYVTPIVCGAAGNQDYVKALILQHRNRDEEA